MPTELRLAGQPLPPVRSLSRTQAVVERDRHLSQMGDLAHRAAPDRDDEELFYLLERRVAELAGFLAECDRAQPTRAQLAELAGLGNGPAGHIEQGATFGQHTLGRPGNGGTADAGFRRIDSRRDVPDAVRERMTRSLDDARGPERDRLARWIATSGDPAYERALGLWLADPATGPATWSDEERAAVRRVTDEARAMNLTDASGGFLVGSVIDYTIMLTTSGAVNPVRSVARRVTTSGDSWTGITSAGAQASWDAEAAQVSDDSPTLASPSIPVYKGQTYIQASWEVSIDAPGLAGQLAPIFADAKDTLEANTLTLGAGGTAPRGIVTAVVAAGAGSIVAVTGAQTQIAPADAVALQNAVPPRWRANAGFMANLSIMNQLRSQVAGTGLTTPMLTDGPDGPRMLGWRVHENSAMDPDVAAGTTVDYVLLAGDFSNYVVVDRIGQAILPIPVVMGANQRPTSEVGWLARWRMGGDIPAGLAGAFRLLNYSG